MTSSTRNVDWSTDSKFFRSQASDYTIDMKYWESKSELTDNDDGDQFFLSRALTWNFPTGKNLWNNLNSTQIGTNDDGEVINSAQGSDLELLYWEAATGKQVNWEQVARSDMIFNRGIKWILAILPNVWRKVVFTKSD